VGFGHLRPQGRLDLSVILLSCSSLCQQCRFLLSEHCLSYFKLCLQRRLSVLMVCDLLQQITLCCSCGLAQSRRPLLVRRCGFFRTADGGISLLTCLLQRLVDTTDLCLPSHVQLLGLVLGVCKLALQR
jgi:hypothetical protein